VPVFRLSRELVFPNPALARSDGLLAVGGDLTPQRLVLAYSNGIFPWFSEGDPILWWSPPLRPVLAPADVYVNRSLAKVMRRRLFEVRFDTACAEVIAACAKAPRPGQTGTWITEEMQRAYVRLHELGVVHSAEAWAEGELVGGLYGVALGGAFFGESMFATRPDASKVAFVALCRQLERWGFGLVDSQVSNEHTERFGTEEIPRDEFLDRVKVELRKPTRTGTWRLDPDLP
jgi:leucyl/phenylalanyl-tRNA---protein transferase